MNNYTLKIDIAFNFTREKTVLRCLKKKSCHSSQNLSKKNKSFYPIWDEHDCMRIRMRIPIRIANKGENKIILSSYQSVLERHVFLWRVIHRMTCFFLWREYVK
jgi:hypothetical protein